jgi:hypothetical protein
MNYSVYVRLSKPHWKEETTWFVGPKREDAVRLAKWLIELGLNAQPIDQEVFAAMPDKIE